MVKFAVIFCEGGDGVTLSNEASAVAALPRVVRALRNDVVGVVARAHVAPAERRIARVDEVWCDDGTAEEGTLEDLRRVYEGQPVIQISSLRESTIFDRNTHGASLVKRLSLLQRKPGLSRSAFCAYWRDVHAPMASCHRHVARYVQNHVTDDSDWPFDGMGEFLITDIDAMRADYETPAGRTMQADVRNFAAAVSTYVVRSQVLVDSLSRTQAWPRACQA